MLIQLKDAVHEEKINCDELFRESFSYQVGDKVVFIMAVIEGDTTVRTYCMDEDAYFNPDNQGDVSDKIPQDILSEVNDLAYEQVKKDYYVL